MMENWNDGREEPGRKDSGTRTQEAGHRNQGEKKVKSQNVNRPTSTISVRGLPSFSIVPLFQYSLLQDDSPQSHRGHGGTQRKDCLLHPGNRDRPNGFWRKKRERRGE
jgi:hypothetical protein